MNRKVLVIGPSRNTRGGITSVIDSYSKTTIWDKWRCKWIESYVDKNVFLKLFYFIKGFCIFLYFLPKTSIVHIHFSEPTSALRKSFFLFTARLLKKITILHFHAFSVDTTIHGTRSKLYMRMFKASDRIFVLSDFWKRQISEFTGESEKIEIIYNPCPNIKEVPTNNKNKQVLFAGTLNKRKGYLDLIKAFANIKEPKGWKLIFAGNGEIDEGKNLAKALGIEDRVLFKGWVVGEEKDNLFRTSSIFCLPSYAEGFPMAVLDAWSFGLPVITTPVGGLPDILEHGINALVFEPGNIMALSENLNNLIVNKELRNKIGQASFQLSETKFSIAAISKDIDNLYNELLIE